MGSGKSPFTSLEATVVRLATREGGRGLTSVGWRGAVLARLRRWFVRDDTVRTLANPRLEALRVYVNNLYRRGGARAKDVAAFLAAGYTPDHCGYLAADR